MKLDFRERKHNWRLEVYNGVTVKMPEDGSIIVFDEDDIKPILDANYPKGKRVWYFNETKDREIAEQRPGKVIFCNPQVLWRHFPESNRKAIKLTGNMIVVQSTPENFG